MMDDLRYNVTVRFNSRLKGAGQSHTCEVEAMSPGKALDEAVMQIVRLPEHGRALYVTGCTIDEIRS